MRKILFAVLLIGIGWLFSGVGNFSLNACNHIQDRLGTPDRFLGLADGDSETPPPLDTLAMIAFEPLGGEYGSSSPMLSGRSFTGGCDYFCPDNADAYLATVGEGSWPRHHGKTRAGDDLSCDRDWTGSMLEELAGMILANSKPAALLCPAYRRHDRKVHPEPDGSPGQPR